MNKPVFLRKVMNKEEGHYAGWYTGDNVSFYVSSVVLPYHGQLETMVFLADNSGNAINWCGISKTSNLDHNDALNQIGFYIVDNGDI